MTKERLWKLSPVLLFLVLVYLTYSGFNESSVRTLQLAVITTAPAAVGVSLFRLSPAILIMGVGTAFGMYHLIELSEMHQAMIGEAPLNEIHWGLILLVPVVPTMYWSFFIITLFDIGKQPEHEPEQ